MDILKDMNIYIDEKEILRLLGYREKDADEEIVECIIDEIEASKEYMEPGIAFEKVNIKSIENNSVVLENGIILDGEFMSKKLKNCSYIIACISTLGSSFDRAVKEAFDTGDYLKGMILDNIGTTAIGYLNKAFWNRLVDGLSGTNIGITSKLSPGDTAWDVSGQKVIFKLIQAEKIGVKLTESCMMLPFKSTSAVYGFGEGIGVAKLGHICTECSMKHCAYRSDNKIPLTININGTREIIDVERGKNLLEVLRENNIFIKNPCGGKGICGKCKVQIVKGGTLESITDRRNLSEEELVKGIRLSCNVNVDKPMELALLEEKEDISILTTGEVVEVEPDPVITLKYCDMDKPKLGDQRSDVRRLSEACGMRLLQIPAKELGVVSEVLNNAGFKATAVLYKERLLNLEEGNTTQNNYGIAVDIGTTTLACYLMDLYTGKTLDVESQVNRQRAYGADVISRINYTIENTEGLKTLNKSILDQLNELIGLLCMRNRIAEERIYDVAVVGNTTMIHLLLGIPCRNIAVSPYIPVVTEELVFDAGEIGLKTKGIVSVLPGLASYVGSDITAGILSSGMLQSRKFSLLLDLGTNGEIALGNENSILACSTAAGPAFEGANIKCGIGGIKGAISKVDLSKDKIYETIGNLKPCGICGSGVMDIAAQMVKTGIIDETGRMVDEDEIGDEKLRKRIVEEDIKQLLLEVNSSDGSKIVFTQKDVREVQLAKAAVRAGVEILLHEMNLKYDDIDIVYIGGGFGNYMDIESSLIIGMLPSEFRGKIKSIGNCAGSGARMYLLSREVRKKAGEIVNKSRYIELSGREDFQNYFVDSMMFE